jgi:hypothetical protein
MGDIFEINAKKRPDCRDVSAQSERSQFYPTLNLERA